MCVSMCYLTWGKKPAMEWGSREKNEENAREKKKHETQFEESNELRQWTWYENQDKLHCVMTSISSKYILTVIPFNMNVIWKVFKLKWFGTNWNDINAMHTMYVLYGHSTIDNKLRVRYTSWSRNCCCSSLQSCTFFSLSLFLPPFWLWCLYNSFFISLLSVHLIEVHFSIYSDYTQTIWCFRRLNANRCIMIAIFIPFLRRNKRRAFNHEQNKQEEFALQTNNKRMLNEIKRFHPHMHGTLPHATDFRYNYYLLSASFG